MSRTFLIPANRPEENAMMKGFIIAMLAAGATLLCAALFWPSRPTSLNESRRASPIASAADIRLPQRTLRNADFPRTYISKIHVDLTSPNHWVTLTWSGPNARQQPTAHYHSSPGRGLGYNNCDDPAESCRVDSNCTPKGTMHVQSFSHTMQGSPEVRFVTWFDTKRGIALHYYPNVPNYPASHGCVRLGEYAARLIHNNSKIGETEVVIDGKWTFVH
jgi:hypothetical protein